MTKPIVLVAGTRPEGIKIAPVYFALKNANMPVILCATNQHTTLLEEVFTIFHMKPDVTLNIMKPNQSLFHITTTVLDHMQSVLKELEPALLLVQGDTSTAMASALAAFYLKIPIGHIEAGLRTDSITSPFPEEMNRRFISMTSSYHFAPTMKSVENLRAEKINDKSIFLTGNTIVDALNLVKNKIEQEELRPSNPIFDLIHRSKLQQRFIILLTTHRRESFNGGLHQILEAIKQCALENSKLLFIYPAHPNPIVQQAIQETNLASLSNVYLCSPLSYIDLVYTLINVDLVATDSGGVIEESVSIGKKVLILRNETERIESIWSELAYLTGTDKAAIIQGINNIVSNHSTITRKSAMFGDGHASRHIVDIIQKIITSSPVATENNSITIVPAIREQGYSMKDVCVIGLGYIGLPTAIIASQSEFKVFGFDIDEQKIKSINNGNPVISEPEIQHHLKKALNSGNFIATRNIVPADYFIISVPTPFTEEKDADLSFVWAAANSIASVLKKGNTIILESTVPIGTTKTLAQILSEKTKLIAGQDFFIAHCPERVLPGKIFIELIYNARIIGGLNQESVAKAKEFYKHFVKGPLYLTDLSTAEMVKLIENSSRDISIAFANQVADIAYSLGLNPFEVIELANKHPRVSILSPSSGVGGHCIAVDPWFLIKDFPAQTDLLKTARLINDQKPRNVIASVECLVDEYSKKNLKRCNVFILGLTYKQDIDDLRESPALLIAQTLEKNEKLYLFACEPHVEKTILESKLPKSTITDVSEGLEQADIIVCLVKHQSFKTINANVLLEKQVLDICGLFHESRADTDQQEKMFWPNDNRYFKMPASLT